MGVGGYEGYDEGYFEGGLSEFGVFLFEEVPGADAEYEEGTCEEGAYPDVHDAVDGGGIEYHGPEVGDFCACVEACAYDVVACWCLLPGVGDDDPDGGEHGAQCDHDGGEEVDFGADAVPTEEEDAEESGFECEGEYAFCCQCAAEYVANVFGVGGPVGAEFKFHDDAGGYADAEDEGEDSGVEPGHVFVELVAGFEVHAFHEYHDEAESYAERRIDVVESDGKGKLNA